MTDCIFCKIVAGTLPSSKVYEDGEVLAFLDIAPVNIGHTLVIPKKHFVDIHDTPETTLCAMMHAAKKVAKAIKKMVGAEGINININNEPAAGQIIFHTHLHVIPRYTEDGFKLWHGRRGYNEGERDEIAQKITQAL